MAEAMRLNLRWDPTRRYWLIPVHGFDGQLLGWQEKGPGHFLNVPPRMRKRRSLFGLAQAVGRACSSSSRRSMSPGSCATGTPPWPPTAPPAPTSSCTRSPGVIATSCSPTTTTVPAGTPLPRSLIELRTVYGRLALYYRYPPDSYGEDPGSLAGVQFRYAAQPPVDLAPGHRAVAAGAVTKVKYLPYPPLGKVVLRCSDCLVTAVIRSYYPEACTARAWHRCRRTLRVKELRR